MKKISQINWKRYKESASGREAISMFKKLYSQNCTVQEVYEVAKKFNPEFFKDINKNEEIGLINTFGYYNDQIASFLDNSPNIKLETGDDYLDLFYSFTQFLTNNDGQDIDKIPQSSYKNILSSSLMVSSLLYAYFPAYFIPNFFVMQFIYLNRLAKKYDIELPEVPKRSDYKERWFYYIDICIELGNFGLENNIEESAELCAFIFDYEFPMIREELENEDEREIPKNPAQAWILVGNLGKEDETVSGFWQANQLTEKGDILLFYERSPVKALNSVWIAQQDGVVDPFFHYYSNTYIGNRISIPSGQEVTFEDFKNSEYFKNRDRKGNFVSKNFQDVSGWQVTYNDYKEILRILESKGFDTKILPKLYEPQRIGDVCIEIEKDVSEKLLVPLLEQMGWVNGIDFRGEVEFNAGRTKTNHSSDKRPDFCLHITERNDDIEAKVAIEVKKHMKTQKEIHETFVQGRSYAKWGGVKVLVLVDMKQIIVYERDNNNVFNEHKPKKFSWAEMEMPDKYSELKRILSC